jgi:uncharacterized protein YmfQ (DUF2313 family)
MASVTGLALKKLLPPGKALSAKGDLAILLDALALSTDEALDFLRDVTSEAIPGTSSETIRLWYDLLGLSFDERQTLVSQQDQLDAVYTSLGGSNLDYLQEQTEKQFPAVDIIEGALGGFEYQIRGDVDVTQDLARLSGLIDRIFPLHLEPDIDVRIIETLDTAYCGISVCGEAITGRVLEP